MKFAFKYLLYFLLFWLHTIDAFAVADFYGNCIKNYDYGNVNVEILEITPINKACKNLCEDQCEIFSRFDRTGVQLNDDVIQDCQTACQKGVADPQGNYFSSYFREETTRNGKDNFIVFIGPQSITDACTDQDAKKYAVAHTELSGLKNGDEVTLRFANGPQKVHMCGRKSIQYTPLLSSSNPATWESEAAQNTYTGQDEHICLSYLDAAKYDSLTFKDLWQEFEKPEYADPKFDKCRWHARNYKYIPTGIAPQDGDDLSLSWRGDYGYLRYEIGVPAFPRERIMSRDEILYCLDPVNSARIDQSKLNICQDLLRANSGIQFYNKGILNDNQLAEPFYSPVFGEDVRNQPFNINVAKAKNCIEPEQLSHDNKFRGLIGTMTDEEFRLEASGGNSNCASEPGYACSNVDSCFRILTMGKGHYMFGGEVDSSDHTINSGNTIDFTSRSELYIRHFDNTDTSIAQQQANYLDNVGGYEFKMVWGGCPMEDGEGLKYAVWDPNDGQNIPDDEWKEIPSEVYFQKEPFVLQTSYTDPNGGALFFRIDSDKTGGGGPYQELYEDYGNRFGEYNVAIRKFGDRGALDPNNPFRKIVILIKDILLGKEEAGGGYTDGATQIVYKGVVSDFRFVQMIQALLVIYVALQAVLFIMGVININQKEFVGRIFKIAVIVAIISPGSWEFLYFNFLKAFIDGSIELIALIVSAAYPDVPNADLSQDPTLIFSIFGAVNKMVFNKPVWAKLAALMLNGFVGLAIAIVILISILIYWLCIVRAVVMYVFSLVGISLLILLAPVFLPLMLFKMTENFFNSWWKLIFSFAMQPVMVFTTITIFNILMITLLYSSLNFTVCDSCIWLMYIPIVGYEECWIPGYRIVHNLHLPGEFAGTFLPLNVLGAGISFLLLAHAMWVFTGFITQITSRIITQMFIRSATVSDQEERIRQSSVSAVELGPDAALEAWNRSRRAKAEKRADDARLARKKRSTDAKKKKDQGKERDVDDKKDDSDD